MSEIANARMHRTKCVIRVSPVITRDQNQARLVLLKRRYTQEERSRLDAQERRPGDGVGLEGVFGLGSEYPGGVGDGPVLILGDSALDVRCMCSADSQRAWEGRLRHCQGAISSSLTPACTLPPRYLRLVDVVAGQELVVEGVPGRLQAVLAVGGRLVGARPGQVAGVQATPDRMAHLGAGQAGPHGPEEEFVIVVGVHSVTGGTVTSWGHSGTCEKGGSNSQY